MSSLTCLLAPCCDEDEVMDDRTKKHADWYLLERHRLVDQASSCLHNVRSVLSVCRWWRELNTRGSDIRGATVGIWLRSLGQLR